MIQIEKKEECCGCYACQQICPVNAIKMVKDEEGFAYPLIQNKLCIDCDFCVNVCPNNTIVNRLSSKVPNINCKLYAAFRNDFNERIKSASGGVFSLLARYVIENKGIVFGAAYQNDYSVSHIKINTLDDIDRLQGSKYVQSKLEGIFLDVKECADSGKLTLFCGTPCQIHSIKNFLGKEYQNVILVDFVCHGVPSAEVWLKYLNEVSQDKKIIKIIPRDKTKGINNAPIKILFEDGTTYKKKYQDSVFLRGFSNNLFLRPSCYNCKHKGENHYSDVTLADFWGIDNILPNFGDKYGVSAVITNTYKGQTIFDKLKNHMTIKEVQFSEFLQYNPSYVSSVAKHQLRDKFFLDYKSNGLHKTINSILGSSLKYRWKRIIQELKWLLLVLKKKFVGKWRQK